MRDVAKNGLLIVFSCVFAIYAMNALLVVYSQINPQTYVNVAQKRGVVFDERSPFEFVDDMRKQGVDVELFEPPSTIAKMGGLAIGAKKILPLCGLGNAQLVSCNESGEYPIYHTDEYGFNNPPGSHLANKVDMALIGDSYTWGMCVDSEYSIASSLKRRGLTAVSYGCAGVGPLFELATLSEYALDMDAEVYIWIIYAGNDLFDAFSNKDSVILQKYLDDSSYRQGLKSMHSELNMAWRNWLAEKIKMNGTEVAQNSKTYSITSDLLLLRTLRSKLGVAIHTSPPDSLLVGAKILAEALSAAKRRVEAKGSKFIVVYLPVLPNENKQIRDIVMEQIYRAEVEFIDIGKELERVEDVRDLLPLGWRGHFSPKGYEFVAESIASHVTTAEQEY